MQYYNDERVVIKSWCDNPEEGAIQQARNVANLPFVVRQVVLLSDCHQGYGVPIGCVFGTKDVIIVNAVGVDIGCGVLAVKTNLHISWIGRETLKKIMGDIRKMVPVGFAKHNSNQEMPIKLEEDLEDYLLKDLNLIVHREYQKSKKQLGTLGGGNHFIEIQRDQNGYVWFMLHSGSRNVGKQVADYYNKKAKELNEKWFSSVDPKYDLAFLHIDDETGLNYLREMQWCLDFAQANRNLMADRIKEAFIDNFGDFPIEFEESINIHHNYAVIENHFGQNLWVHRKGATSARKGELGIIPGSQGTASYIVKGLGNKESFQSCSHGAGRKMSRTRAQKDLDLEEEQRKLEDKGVIHAIRNKKDLDEASGAYKDIDIVMEEQKDLVEIVEKLEPIGVIKG